MAKQEELPQAIKGALGSKVRAGRKLPSRRKQLLNPDEEDANTADRQDLTRRLVIICKQISSADSSLRAERIAKIQKAIAGGCYRISSEDIADKLIDQMVMSRLLRK